jgi:hypothetical protein
MKHEDLNDPHTYWKEILIVVAVLSFLLGVLVG